MPNSLAQVGLGELPTITRMAQTAPGTWRIWWDIPEGFVCQVERSLDLEEWAPIGEPLTSESQPKWTEDDGLAGVGQAYWRINAEGIPTEALFVPFEVIELPRRTHDDEGNPLPPDEGHRYEVSWDSVPGRTYRLERSHTLDDDSWSEVFTVVAFAELTDHIDEIDAPRTFWRVLLLDDGSGPITFSPLEVDPQLAGSNEALLQVAVGSDAPLSSVEFFDGDTFLGTGIPDAGNTWTFPVAWDQAGPRAMHISVRATPLGGDPVESEQVGLLVANPDNFVPLGENGAPEPGGFVSVDGESDELAAFAFYPEGLSDPENSTGAHFVFAAGSVLHPTENGVLQFSDGEFYRGHVDPEPLMARAGERALDLATIGPAEVSAEFDQPADEEIELLWEGNRVVWKSGSLSAEDGWSALAVEPVLGGLDLPDVHAGVAVRKDPETGESYLVICFHGAWTTGADGATFRVPSGDPLKLYLRNDGRLDARGTIDVQFPDGAVLRGSVAWRNSVFEIHIEGKGFVVPALGSLRSELPTTATEALPDRVRAADLDKAATQLAGLREAMRGIAQGGSGQAPDGSSAPEGTLATPPDGIGLAMRAWAGRLESWDADRNGEPLPEPAMRDLTGLLRSAGVSGSAAFDLESALTLALQVLRIQGALESVLDASADADAVRDAASAAEARLLAAVDRMVSSGLDNASETFADRAELFIEIEKAAVTADDAGRSARGGGSTRQQKIAALKQRFVETVLLFRELQIQINDTDGSDNPVLTALGEDELLKRMAGVLAAMRLFGLTEITQQSPSTRFPLLEAWDQLNDVFLAKHAAATTGIVGFADAETLRRAMIRRARFLKLQSDFGHARNSDTGSTLSNEPAPFNPRTRDIVVAWLQAQERLPRSVVAETCRADMETLITFQEFTLDQGTEMGFAVLYERASACEKILTATSDSGALCAPVATALRTAGLPVEEAALGDEGDREFRITGRYESASVASSFPVTLQISRAGRLILGHVHYHGGPNSPSGTFRLLGLLAFEDSGLADYSILLRQDDGTKLLGGDTWKKGFLRATETGGEVRVELFSLPSNQLLKSFVKSGNLPAQSASFRNFLPGEAQALFDAQARAPLHRAQVEAMKGQYARIRTAINAYAAVGSPQQRRAEALNVGRRLQQATSTISLSQLPVARQVMCEALSRTTADLNGEEISHWTMLRIIHDQNRNELNMEPFARFMGTATPPARGPNRYKYTISINDAAIGRSFFSVKGMTIEITQERVDGTGGSNDFNLTGALGQAGLSVSLTEFLRDLGGGAGGANAIVYSDVEYSEQSLAGPVFFMGAQAGGGVGAIERQFGPTVLILYGNETLEPLIIPLPIVDGGNNLTDAGIELAMGVGFVGSFSEAPPSQFSFAQGLTERKFTAEAGINGAVHFASDQSDVRVCGWSELRLLVAEMRAIFESEDGHVSILGFADATGPPDSARSDTYNLELSQARADSVKAAIANLVGEGLAIEPDRFRAIGLGRHPAMGRTSPNEGQLNEAEAAFLAEKKASLPTLVHGQENAGWRTVSIILNNTIRIDLNGAKALAE